MLIHILTLLLLVLHQRSHLKLAIKNLKDKNRPKVLQIESLMYSWFKNLKEFIKLKNKYKSKVKIFGGYNHLLTENTKIAEKILKKKNLENFRIKFYNNEEWSGIFNAHFCSNPPKILTWVF